MTNIHAGSSVGELVYVRLSGNNPPGEQRIAGAEDQATTTRRSGRTTAADYAREQLEALIRKFEDEKTALYLAEPVDVVEPLRRL